MLSSGTIGAALSSSLSRIRSIAISYGTVLVPTPENLFEPAHILVGRIMRHLWENWGYDEQGLRTGEVDLYNVNIPLIEALLEDEGLQVCWTRIWRNSYGRLFKAIPQSVTDTSALTAPAGPHSPNVESARDTTSAANDRGTLSFRFAPSMQPLLNPTPASLPIGTDAWAIHKGWASVTPIRASFAEPPYLDVQDQLWEVKL